MKIYFLIIPTAIFLCACSESPKEKKESTPAPVVKIAEPAIFDGCYEMIISGDTASLNIKQNNASFSGSLLYNRKGKDSNKGNVMLSKINDRVEGYYTFESEGKISVRQIIFKIIGNTLAEGYGDIEMKNDTAILKYPHALNFEEKHAFKKVNCK